MSESEEFEITIAVYDKTAVTLKKIKYKTKSGLVRDEIAELVEKTIENYLPYKLEEKEITIKLILIIITCFIIFGVVCITFIK